MKDNIDLDKPLTLCTLRDIQAIVDKQERSNKHYVYGIAGLAKLFGCSLPTAQRIKSSGEIDEAISQIGSIIIIDAEQALDLLKVSKKYKNSPLLKKKLSCNNN